VEEMPEDLISLEHMELLPLLPLTQGGMQREVVEVHVCLLTGEQYRQLATMGFLFAALAFRRARHYSDNDPTHNTLFKNPDEENTTEIEVSDPMHPLFGRHFPLISVSAPLHGPGNVLVRYREYMALRVPVNSTTLALSRPVISTKLTHAAVKELVTIAEDCEALNALSSKPDLEASSSRTATSDHNELSSILQEVLMSRSELVSQAHLQRKALIYIRQSTPHQVLSNQESLRLQYALQQRAIDLGWRQQDIEIIDADLGMTGASASHRVGFQEVVTRVTLGQVGMILSVDVTRLSRNCSDWYPLLDVCGYRGCLIADRDGIYDPGSANGACFWVSKGNYPSWSCIRSSTDDSGTSQQGTTRRVGFVVADRLGAQCHRQSPQGPQSRDSRSS